MVLRTGKNNENVPLHLYIKHFFLFNNAVIGMLKFVFLYVVNGIRTKITVKIM